MPDVQGVRDRLDSVADRQATCRRPAHGELEQAPSDADALVVGVDEEAGEEPRVSSHEGGRVADDLPARLGDEAPLAVMAHEVAEGRSDRVDTWRRGPAEAMAPEQLALGGHEDCVLGFDIGIGRLAVLDAERRPIVAGHGLLPSSMLATRRRRPWPSPRPTTSRTPPGSPAMSGSYGVGRPCAGVGLPGAMAVRDRGARQGFTTIRAFRLAAPEAALARRIPGARGGGEPQGRLGRGARPQAATAAAIASSRRSCPLRSWAGGGAVAATAAGSDGERLASLSNLVMAPPDEPPAGAPAVRPGHPAHRARPFGPEAPGRPALAVRRSAAHDPAAGASPRSPVASRARPFEPGARRGRSVRPGGPGRRVGGTPARRPMTAPQGRRRTAGA